MQHSYPIRMCRLPSTAFTLIELLVVVAVDAILIAMLLLVIEDGATGLGQDCS